MPYCQSCERKVEDVAFCPRCGSDLIDKPPAESAPTPEGDPDETPSPTDVDRPEPAPHTDRRTETEPPVDRHAPKRETTDPFENGAIRFGFSYPVTNGWKPILITAGLVLLSWLFIPVLLVYGYTYRLGRATIRGDRTAPSYTDWFGLLTDGLLLILVTIPWAVAVFFFGAVPLTIGIESGSPGMIGLGLLVVLFGSYAGGSVLATFMATGSVTNTYRGLRFLQFVRTIEYLKAYVMILLGYLLMTLIVGLLVVGLTVTIIGIVLIPPLYLLAVPFFAFLPYLVFGYYYREAVGRDVVQPMDEGKRTRATI